MPPKEPEVEGVGWALDRLADKGLFHFNLGGRLLSAFVWLVPATAVLAYVLTNLVFFGLVGTLVICLPVSGGFLAFPEALAKRSWKVFWAALMIYAAAVFAGEYLTGVEWAYEWLWELYQDVRDLALQLLFVGCAAGAVTGWGTRCLSGLLAGVASGPLAGYLAATVLCKLAALGLDPWFATFTEMVVLLGVPLAILPLVIYLAVWLGVRLGARSDGSARR